MMPCKIRLAYCPPPYDTPLNMTPEQEEFYAKLKKQWRGIVSELLERGIDDVTEAYKLYHERKI